MIDDLKALRPTRRNFLAGAGAAGTAAVLAGCGSSSVTSGTPVTPPTNPVLDISDNDVLNFALNLEYLEAEFYLRAATGSGLSATDAGSGAGGVTGGTAVVGMTPVMQNYLNEIAQDELNHVRFLQTAISGNTGTPVVRPTIDFTAGFTALATAAGITGGFNPFASPQAFLVGAFVFEDVGVTAYHGAAPLILNSKILSAAASILAVEAYHAAEVRTMLVGMAAASGDQTYVNLANQVSALRGQLGGGNETTLSVNSIVAADSTNAIAFSRTTDQVLHIVYGAPPAAGVTSGAFFPNGLNGTITTTTK